MGGSCLNEISRGRAVLVKTGSLICTCIYCLFGKVGQRSVSVHVGHVAVHGVLASRDLPLLTTLSRDTYVDALHSTFRTVKML